MWPLTDARGRQWRLAPGVSSRGISSGPLPLDPSAVALMTPVAPGQWTDLPMDYDTEFEVRRTDRVELEFRHGDRKQISRA